MGTGSRNRKPIVSGFHEGGNESENLARGDARQLGALLGHFHTRVRIRGADAYQAGEMESYDVVFFIGFGVDCSLPSTLMQDARDRKKTLAWLNTGMVAFDRYAPTASRYGFEPLPVLKESDFPVVHYGPVTFTR